MMNMTAFLGAIELGLIYAFVGIGVYLSFRILDFPDLTVDGSFVLGASVFAILLINGVNPWVCMIFVLAAGGLAGLLTAFLNIQLKILNLLASILIMTALYTINLRVMGGFKTGLPNLPFYGYDTLITPFEAYFHLDAKYVRPLLFGAFAFIALIIVWKYLTSESGLAMRATGINPRMAKAQGISTARYVYTGMALSNALVAFGGALMAQSMMTSEITIGIGTIVYGLAAVIIGEAIFRTRSIFLLLLACVVGSIIFRVVTAFALSSTKIGVNTSDMQLITAVIVVLFLVVPRYLGAKNND